MTAIFQKSMLFVCVIGLAIMLTGCRDPSRPNDLPTLYPYTLTVVQEGRGLSDAEVMLYATETDIPKWVIAGNTDANGIVILKTHGRFPGVPLGEYKVVVSKTERVSTGTPKPSPSDGEGNLSSQQPVDIYYLIEKKFTDISTTPLTISIKKGTNAETVDVGKQVREKSNIIVM